MLQKSTLINFRDRFSGQDGGGVPPSQVRTGGYTFLGQDRGYPILGQDLGTPSQVRMGVPWSTPLSGLDGGTPHWDWMGLAPQLELDEVPLSGLDGVPPGRD